MGARAFEAGSQAVNFFAKPILTQTRVLQFFFDSLLPCASGEISQIANQTLDAVATHTLCADQLCGAILDDFGNATEFFADSFRPCRPELAGPDPRPAA